MTLKNRQKVLEVVSEDAENIVVIQKDELQILLNIFGKQSINLDYPLFDLKLIKAKTSGDCYKLNLLCGKEDFQDLYENCSCSKEFPSFGDISNCMLLSGIIQYDNLDEFKDKMKVYEQVNKNKVVYFGFDTNMFYHGFPSQATFLNKYRYLVANTGYEEIESAINYKYNPNQINEMKRCASYNANLLGNLGNQKIKRSRIAAYVAMKEYNNVRRQSFTKVESDVASTKDSEENDKIIVNAIHKFDVEDSDAYVVFLTADTNVSNLCEGKGLDFFHFQYPSYLDAKECSSDQLVKLIYWFAIVNGFVKCNSVVIFGEFVHKGRDDDALKLLFYDRKLFETFKRELEICRKLMDLKIAK
jgi:hypothetical protein